MRVALALAAAGLMLAGIVTDAAAQGRGNGNRSKGRNDDRVSVIVVQPDRRGRDRWEIPVEIRRVDDRGPAFCRSGAGHPVYGRQWCLAKGYGLGRQRGIVWSRGAWGDVVFRSRRRDRELRRRELIEVLGDIVLRRLESHGSRIGARGPLTGRWLTSPGGPLVLHVLAGGLPLAELTDLTGDGRVDVVLLNSGW